MKTVFIGDIHGKIEVMDFVEKQFPEHQKIFVGDFVDAFDRTRKQQLACVEKALKMIDKGDTRVVFGNHELSYLVPREMRCSGFAGTMDALLMPLKSDMWKKFEHHIWMPEQKLLVTHAGLTKHLWDEFELTFDNLGEKLEEWKRQQWHSSPNGWIGRARGGLDTAGGIFWCDFNDEFRPIGVSLGPHLQQNLRQVFGHTGWVDLHQDLTDGIRERATENYCLDCLQRKPEFLEFDPERETSQFKVLSFSKKQVFGSATAQFDEDELEQYRGYNG